MHHYQKRLFNRRYVFFGGIFLMLMLAFVQGYHSTHDLHWGCDIDFDRDLAFIQGNLDGHFGKDPSFLGEYLWYSPLLFSIESWIVRITGMPSVVVVTQAGIYLNALAPVAFVMMVAFLFSLEVGICALLSFLFLASGSILGWGSATYSPWLYPVSFVQFLFYINIIFLYKALSTKRIRWFLLLGLFTGISFLGHVAPAIIMILMITGHQAYEMIKAVRIKNWPDFRKYLIQSGITALAFLITASPILISIIGRYRLHYINRAPFEYVSGIFALNSFMELLRENINLVFMVSLAGLYWFYKYFREQIIRNILFSWLAVCIFMFEYSTCTPILAHRLHIYLPVTIPSFHYFFYLKALESVFFGLGLVWIVKGLLNWFNQRRANAAGLSKPLTFSPMLLTVFVLFISLIYFPVYRSRNDFTYLREMAMQRENNKEQQEVYFFITRHIPCDKVILCEMEQSMFPVMASGRKMVSTVFTFSNPFVSFEQRENDRKNMLDFMVTGKRASDKLLFSKYKVSYILLSQPVAEKIRQGMGLPGEVIFRNKSFILLSLSDKDSYIL